VRLKVAGTDSRAKLGKETVAGYVGGQNGSHTVVRRLTQACSGSAHPWFRYARPQLRLKQQLLTSADQNGTSERED
jgi:hypothetical protein